MKLLKTENLGGDGGKWFEFECKDGTKISLKLRYPSHSERKDLGKKTREKDELTGEVETDSILFVSKAFQMSVVDWKGIEDHEGKNLDFNKKYLDDSVFSTQLAQVELKEKDDDGDNVFLGSKVIKVISNPETYYNENSF